jgi:hypothetical protein
MKKAKYSKKAWTIEEDKILVEAIQSTGPRFWDVVAKQVPGRSGK